VGDVLDLPVLGMRITFLRTAAETLGELLEYEVVGRPRGFPAQAHLHPQQAERHEVLEGTLRVRMHGADRDLGPGESVTIPAGMPHRHYAVGEGAGRVRVTLRPALATETLLERLADFSAEGLFTRGGYPKPRAAASLILDFPDEGRAARPPAVVQRAFARAVLALPGAARGDPAYVFVDEWDVQAPPEAVFDALADARSYPTWWRTVYLEAEADGPPRVGGISWQHFKGRLPYHLRTESRTTRLERPTTLEADVTGDLRGCGLWTLTPRNGGTHVRFDWRVYADKPILRLLTPVLRSLFRWNHSWAIARAMEGLEPYARELAASAGGADRETEAERSPR